MNRILMISNKRKRIINRKNRLKDRKVKSSIINRKNNNSIMKIMKIMMPDLILISLYCYKYYFYIIYIHNIDSYILFPTAFSKFIPLLFIASIILSL